MRQYKNKKKGHITLDEYMKATKRLEATIKGYEMALTEVFKAYPQDIFPDTAQGERDPIIEKYPGFIDRTSAMMGRHIAKVIRERASYFTRGILEDGRAVKHTPALDGAMPEGFCECGISIESHTGVYCSFRRSDEEGEKIK